MSALQRGDSGDEVKALQDGLVKLGFAIQSDGDFGEQTHNAVITIQSVFGYDVDGIAGPATQQLVEAQGGYGWTLEHARQAPAAAAAPTS